MTLGMWWWPAFGDDLLALGWLLDGYNTCFFGDSLTDDIFMTRINGPKKEENNEQTASNCEEFFVKMRRETKERKLRMIFPVARHGRFFFSSRFCFAFAICLHFSQFALSA